MPPHRARLRRRLPRLHRPVQDGRAFYFDPALGRFTQPDPSGQEKNPYHYATGDPINHTDPTGLNAVSNPLPAKDLLDLGTDAWNGDGGSLEGDLIGTAAGLATETACMFGAGVGSAIAAESCGLVGSYVGDKAKDAYVSWYPFRTGSSAAGPRRSPREPRRYSCTSKLRSDFRAGGGGTALLVTAMVAIVAGVVIGRSKRHR
ncbi:RHS repeat-associated core domain-containing protein [Streptomyces sp. NPDC014746]|uniref:RHS repeat-associated core domain-containing protein n=1 Tax=Streptomyces sp. NPDC014746 TaxID=3364904 RepID=UPI0036F73D1A